MSELPLPSLEPPTLTTASRVVIALIIAALASVVIVLWFVLDVPPAVAAAVGDAIAPFVGILTAAALGAAIWSVTLQRHAIKVQLQELQAQRSEMVASREALQEQTKAQNELAAHQLKQLRAAELRELRSAYASWFAEIREWLSTCLTEGNAMRHGERQRNVSSDGFRRLEMAMWQVVLLDTASTRVIKVRSFSSPLGLPGDTRSSDGGLNLQAIGAWQADRALERLRDLDEFKTLVTNWFQTGEERPI